jgi:predicted metalloprotease with PDZ domain
MEGFMMKNSRIAIRTSIFLALCCVMFGVASPAVAVEGQDKPKSDMPRPHGDDPKMPNGVIGVALNVGAERIGDPAVLYVGMIHPEGPAHQAGMAHGDEILTVDGVAVTGKSYEEVIGMIRGKAGTTVKLRVKGEGSVRDVAVTRIASEALPKGPGDRKDSHGYVK